MSSRVRFWKSAVLAAVLGGVVVSALPVRAQDAGDVRSKKVTLNLENADLVFALKLLFNSVSVNFKIDPAVQGTVTANLTDVPFEVALKAVLTSSGSPLTYRTEDGIYYVSPRI